MITIYTYNGNVVKDSTTGKWFTKPSGPGPTPPAPVVIQPDIPPNQSQFQEYSKFNGPANQGILDYNTTYQLNYPNGIDWVYIYYIRNEEYNMLYEDKASYLQTFSISGWGLKETAWNNTSYLYIRAEDRSGNTIYQPVTLTPVS